MTIHVVITDDSDISAEVLRRALSVAPDIRVVGRARGVDELMASQWPGRADVILLDIWMPGRTSLGVVNELSQRAAVLVVSDADEDSPLAREAVAQGASGFVCKRTLAGAEGGQRLRVAVREAATAQLQSPGPCVAVVGSSGAMPALGEIAAELGSSSASVLIVQHMPTGRDQAFAAWLTELGLPATTAVHGDRLRPGRALVAPGDRHLVLNPDGATVGLHRGPLVEGHRPSGSVLLGSLVPLGARAVAVILSGMGSDGATGVEAVLGVGGSCLVQDPIDCAVGSMPSASLAVSQQVRAYRRDQLGVSILRRVRRIGHA